MVILQSQTSIPSWWYLNPYGGITLPYIILMMYLFRDNMSVMILHPYEDTTSINTSNGGDVSLPHRYYDTIHPFVNNTIPYS